MGFHLVKKERGLAFKDNIEDNMDVFELPVMRYNILMQPAEDVHLSLVPPVILTWVVLSPVSFPDNFVV